MKTRLVFIIAIVISLLTLGEQNVTVTGTAAIIGGDRAAARDKAVESALRSAVEQVVGTMVDSETIVDKSQLLEDKIYTQSSGYVSSYKILSEKAEEATNLYKVKIEAVVKEGDLQNDLTSVGLLIRRMKMPRVAVVFSDEGDAAQSILMKALKDRGFYVVDTHGLKERNTFFDMSDYSSATAMKRYGAEVVIKGKADAQRGNQVMNSGMYSFQANLMVKALKTDTGELLGTSTASGKAVHTGIAGKQQAIESAANIISDDIINQILKQWQSEVSGNRMLTVILRGFTKTEADSFSSSLLRSGRGVSTCVVRSVEGNEATLEVSMKGDAGDLSKEVQKIFKRYKIVKQTQNSLTIAR